MTLHLSKALLLSVPVLFLTSGCGRMTSGTANTPASSIPSGASAIQQAYSTSARTPAHLDTTEWLTYSLAPLRLKLKYPSTWRVAEWNGPDQNQYNAAFETTPDARHWANEITLKIQDDTILKPTGGYLNSIEQYYRVALGQQMRAVQLPSGVPAEELAVTNNTDSNSFYVVIFQQNGYDYELRSGATMSDPAESVDVPWTMARTISFTP